MQNVTICLGFNNQAEEAVNFYTAIVKNSRIVATTRYGDAGPGPKGSVLTVNFELDGRPFMALNGGPSFAFASGTSIMVMCDTQQEIDQLWERLSDGGHEVQCGWVTDKFGLSWQVVPTVLSELLRDPNPAKSQSVMKAMLQMVKLDIAGLERASEQAA